MVGISWKSVQKVNLKWLNTEPPKNMIDMFWNKKNSVLPVCGIFTKYVSFCGELQAAVKWGIRKFLKHTHILGHEKHYLHVLAL